jgi:hypothetical protein
LAVDVLIPGQKNRANFDAHALATQYAELALQKMRTQTVRQLKKSLLKDRGFDHWPEHNAPLT